MKKIVLTGGGTAGHIMPNLALLPFLKDFEIHYIGRPCSMEEELVKRTSPDIIFHPLDCPKFSRKLSLKLLTIPFQLQKAKREAKQILKKTEPAVIFSKGGFVALPAMLACGDIPLILHESDFSMGLANRMGAKRAYKICTSFAPLSENFKNGVHTGAPLRQEIYQGDKRRAEAECGLVGRQNLLIMGGSLGAAAINDAVCKNLDALTARYNIVHLAGKGNTLPTARPNYFPLPFTDKIADYFAWSDVCVTRGGANALFELVALGLPSLVIPLPKGVSRGDQIDNAEYFEKAGCVRVLKQEQLTESPAALLSALDALLFGSAKIRSACKSAPNIDGTKTIADLIRQTTDRSL